METPDSPPPPPPEKKPSLLETLRKYIEQEPEGSIAQCNAIRTKDALVRMRVEERAKRTKELKRRKAAKRARKITRAVRK